LLKDPQDNNSFSVSMAEQTRFSNRIQKMDSGPATTAQGKHFKKN
jgi:hypothetical protein